MLLAVVAAAIIVPAAVFAWGPNRETFTIANPSDHVQFNSITDNPNIGDERNFVGIREVGSANTWYDDMNVENGKEYFVRMYVHNNAADSLNLKAENVTAKFNLPSTTGKEVRVDGFLSASNVGADTKGNAGQYAEVYDHATFKSSTDFNVAYIPGSLQYENNHYGSAGTSLPESIFTSAGAKLGYDQLNGVIPGCFKYAGYVSFKVKAQVTQELNYNVTKKVSKHGENKWVESYKAQPGETVDYIINYKNTGTAQNDGVTFRDTLPEGMTYVPGSTKWYNASHQEGVAATSDNLVNGIGINVGSYLPGSNAWIIFSAKVKANDDLKECGTNTLRNVAKVNTGGYGKEDDAIVTVDKYCKPEAKYVCKSLNVDIVSDNSFKFTTDYSVENATFNKITYIIRDANGNEVDRKDSTEKTYVYNRAIAGKYTVQAVITVTVDGQTKTTTDTVKCKAPFEVPAKPVVAYTCDSLTVKRLDRTKFRFTTTYSVQNATFKSVSYIIRDANDTEVQRLNDQPAIVEYTRDTVGAYTVQAVVSFTVNNETKTATNNCKQPFDVPAQPEYCEVPGKEHLPKNSPDCVENPEYCPIPGKENLPKDSKDCVETPPELPHTGLGDNIVAFLGLGSLIASIGYYVASRRALS